MATYVTQATLEARFGADRILELTAVDGGTTVDADRLAAVIANVSAEIDAALRGHYTLPLSEPLSPLLKSIAEDMTFYALHEIPLDADQPARQRADKASEKLRHLQSGVLTLDLPTTDADSDGGGSAAGLAASQPFARFAIFGSSALGTGDYGHNAVYGASATDANVQTAIPWRAAPVAATDGAAAIPASLGLSFLDAAPAAMDAGRHVRAPSVFEFASAINVNVSCGVNLRGLDSAARLTLSLYQVVAGDTDTLISRSVFRSTDTTDTITGLISIPIYAAAGDQFYVTVQSSVSDATYWVGAHLVVQALTGARGPKGDAGSGATDAGGLAGFVDGAPSVDDASVTDSSKFFVAESSSAGKSISLTNLAAKIISSLTGAKIVELLSALAGAARLPFSAIRDATFSFLGLSDTPSSYAAGKYAKVNAAGNALEFVDAPAPTAGQISAIFNAAGAGSEIANAAIILLRNSSGNLQKITGAVLKSATATGASDLAVLIDGGTGVSAPALTDLFIVKDADGNTLNKITYGQLRADIRQGLTGGGALSAAQLAAFIWTATASTTLPNTARVSVATASDTPSHITGANLKAEMTAAARTAFAISPLSTTSIGLLKDKEVWADLSQTSYNTAAEALAGLVFVDAEASSPTFGEIAVVRLTIGENLEAPTFNSKSVEVAPIGLPSQYRAAQHLYIAASTTNTRIFHKATREVGTATPNQIFRTAASGVLTNGLSVTYLGEIEILGELVEMWRAAMPPAQFGVRIWVTFDEEPAHIRDALIAPSTTSNIVAPDNLGRIRLPRLGGADDLILDLSSLSGGGVEIENARLDMAAFARTTNNQQAGSTEQCAFSEASGANATDWLAVGARNGGGNRATISEAGNYAFFFDDTLTTATSTEGDSNSRTGIKLDIRMLDSAGTLKRYVLRDGHYFRADTTNITHGAGTGTWTRSESTGFFQLAAGDRLEVDVVVFGASGHTVSRAANVGYLWIQQLKNASGSSSGGAAGSKM